MYSKVCLKLIGWRKFNAIIYVTFYYVRKAYTLGLLDYDKYHNHGYFGQYFNHGYLKWLLVGYMTNTLYERFIYLKIVIYIFCK